MTGNRIRGNRIIFLEEEIAIAEEKMKWSIAVNPILKYMQARLAEESEQPNSHEVDLKKFSHNEGDNMNKIGNWGIMLIGIAGIIYATSHAIETTIIWQDISHQQSIDFPQMKMP